METNPIVQQLESEWSLESGSLGRLRRGIFDEAAMGNLFKLLETIDLGDAVEIDRRLVSLIWYIPLFMSWQHERVQKNGGSLEALKRAEETAHSIITRILGIP